MAKTKKRKTISKTNAKTSTAIARKRAKAARKRAPGKGKSANRAGVPFEQRARDALQFLYADEVVKHNEPLLMEYGRTRQFDVTRRTGAEVLVQAIEAKDHGRPVEYEKVEAFEKKVSQLKVAPTQRPALVSARGFQEGPIERKKFYGGAAADLYQLRTVQDDDWEGRIKSLQIAGMVSQLTADDVTVTFSSGKPLPEGALHFAADRAASFLFDAGGHIVGNLLDILNGLMRSMAGNDAVVGTRLDVPLPPDAHLRVSGELFLVLSASVVPRFKKLETRIDADLGKAARDTLIDAASGRKWIIPDPDKAISASKKGFDLALTYERAGTFDLGALAAVPETIPTEDHELAEFVSALQLQIALRALRAGDREGDEDGYEDLRKDLAEATTLFTGGDFDAAAKIYWNTCQRATSLVALVNLAAIEQRRGRLEEALQLALRSIELFPLEVNGFANAALLLIDLGRLEDAGTVIRGAKAVHAGHPELLRAEGRWLLGEKQLSKAARVFNQLVTINANDGPSRLGLAICEWEQGRREEAVFDATQAAAQGLSSGSEGAAAVRMLMQTNRWAQAVTIGTDVLARIGATDSRRQELQMLTAMSAYEAGDRTRARALSADLTGTDPRLVYLNSLLAYSEGRVREALDGFNEYCVARPSDLSGWRNAALCLSDLQQFVEAHEVLKRAAPGAHSVDGEYWAFRAVTAARAADLSDATASAEQASRLGVDAAAVLMDASQAVIAAGRLDLGVELRREASKYPTEKGPILVERALDHIWQLALARGEDPGAALDALVDDAERKGAGESQVVYARMFLALVRADVAAVGALTVRATAATMPQGYRNLLATEALARRRPQLALDLLGFGPDVSTTRPGPMTFPHPVAVRALALMHTGRVKESLGLERGLSEAPEHPLHLQARAFVAYARNDLAKCLALLDAADRLLGRSADIALRGQALAESALYGPLLDLMRSILPTHPVVPHLAAWAQRMPIPAGKVWEFVQQDALLATALRSPMPRPEGCEHSIIVRKDDKWARTVLSTGEWEAGLTHVSQLFPNATPFLLRTVEIPVCTIRRLLGPTAD